MTYEDYVYFMLSEEDRGNEHSLRYWFACVDLDGDGCIGHMIQTATIGVPTQHTSTSTK